MCPRPLSIAILALVGVAAVSDVLALGFGRIPESMTFGQAVDLAVPLRVDPGENPVPGCLQAEIHVGERRLAPGTVLVTLERRGEASDDVRVRIRSAQVVQEPLVAVDLSVGCAGAVSRSFIVFADPPDTRIEAARAPAADESAAVEGSTARASMPAVPAPQPGRRASSPGGAASGMARAPASAARQTRAKTARKGPAEGARERSQAKAPAPALAARSEAPHYSTQGAAAPRLKLEEPEELLKAAARTVAAQDSALASAAQAASAAEAAASAADQRLLELAANLRTLRDEAGAHRATMDQLRTRLAQAEDRGRMQAALVALVVALGALALWLGWRVRALQRERQAAWWQAAAAAGGAGAEAPFAPDTATVLPAAGLPVSPGVAVPAIVPEDEAALPPLQRGALLPASALVEHALIRPVSVDELIDLEQQAEFFVVLGDDDAAVDLLMSHLRSTGGTSPLPYLKLLEIYRRRDDRDAYERMRKRFSQRFNAMASGWGDDPDGGRDLQDYPSVLASLQACWPLPLDAMAELENLLFRKRSGELFELPAYRDVLTLYSVARDLHRQADRPSADVDVLLPLAAGDELGLSAPPSIFDSLAPRVGDANTALENQPTAPVDLDLSEPPAPRDSRVGELSPVRVTLRQGY
jgi:pilus assembly protein FimV